MKNYFALLIILFGFLISTDAQISGNVYWDLNNNGSKSAVGVFPIEKGVYGIEIRAYNSSNSMIASTTTNASGDFSFPSISSFPVRLEFTTPKDVCVAKRGSAGNSNVQFILSSTTSANLGIIDNNSYASGNNPFAVSNAYTNGNALASGIGEAGLRQNLLVFPFTLDGTMKTGSNYHNRWLGSIFGITSQKETGTVLMAAYLKRHASFGPGGMDAIYKTVISAAGDASQPTVLFNLSSLGINVGVNPRTFALPNNPGIPNTDLGVFGQIGKRGIGNIDMADNGKELFVTNLFENKIHRIDVGMPIKNTFSSTDVTGTWIIPGPALAGTEWHIMGVKYYQGMLYVGGVSSIQRTTAPVASQANLDADHVNLRAYVYQLNPDNGNLTEVLQIPLNYRRGNVIDQFRYEFKNNWWRAWQNNGDIDIVRNDFNNGLETYPQSSAPYNTLNNTGLIYPQPMLSDIEFDSDGSMIIALRDRFGDQGGLNNFFEGVNGNQPTSGGNYFRTFACGEVLRAGKNGTIWTIENNASVTNNGETKSSNLANLQGTPPANASNFSGTYNPTSGSPWGWNNTNGFGPGGRYYYYNYAFDALGVPISNIQDGSFSGSKVHYMKSYGGMALLHSTDELIQTALSPEGGTFSSGVIKFSNNGAFTGTNAGNMTDQQELVPSVSLSAGPESFGKANGMGDVEVVGFALPIEIGNIIWNDVNSNGLQDANESGIGNITILLRSPGIDGVFGNGDDQVWTTITDVNGHYYFDNTIVNDHRKLSLNYIGLPGNSGILNNQNYRLEIDLNQPGLTNFEVTNSNMGASHIDSDGVLGNLPGIGNRLYVNVNTSNNNYDFDFGLKPASVLSLNTLELNVVMYNNLAKLNWHNKDEANTIKYTVEKKNGTSFEFVDNIIASGLQSYQYTYDLSREITNTMYFRIKSYSTMGTLLYSNIVTVRITMNKNVTLIPNPFTNQISIVINSEKKKVVLLEITNSTGQVVFQKNYSIVNGSNKVDVTDLSHIAPGTYNVAIIEGNTKLFSEIILKK